MANRFQTPIDNQFIDTYVPIPFQELMNAAQIKQGRWDEAAGSLAEAESAAQLVRAIEGTPDAAYRDEVVNYMKDRAAYYTSGKLDLSDPLVQNQINADIRKVDQVRLQSIGDSRSNWDAERVKEAELRQKGEWNDRLYEPKWGEWDSRRGIYTGNAEAEIKTSTELEPYFKDMETEFKGIVGDDPNSLAMYARNEVGRNRIREHARNIANQMKDTTWADQQLRLKYGSGYKDKISTAEQQAYIEEAINNYAVELWPQSDIQPMSKQGPATPTAQPYSPADILFTEGAKNSVLTEKYDSKNKTKVRKEVDNTVAKLEKVLKDSEYAKNTVGERAGLSDEERSFIEGELNETKAHQTNAGNVANEIIGEGPELTYQAAVNELVSTGFDQDTASQLLASVVGTGIGTIGTKFVSRAGGLANTVSRSAQDIKNLGNKAADMISSLVPVGYYDVGGNEAKKKEKIAAEIEEIIRASGGDVEHSNTLGDYIAEYFDSVGAKMAVKSGQQYNERGQLQSVINPLLAGEAKDGEAAFTAGADALATINDYRKQMKAYSNRYEDIYAETLQSGLQYMVSGVDITLPTYTKIPNSANGFEIKGRGESRVAKWFNTLPSYKEGVIIGATDHKGKAIKDKDAMTELRDLNWEDVKEQTISTAPKFDREGNPYLTIKVATGTGNQRKSYDIKVMYNNLAINSIKEDLLLQGTPAARAAYDKLNNAEISIALRKYAKVGDGATIMIHDANGVAHNVNTKLNSNTGRYTITANYGDQTVYEDGLTLEEAEDKVMTLSSWISSQTE